MGKASTLLQIFPPRPIKSEKDLLAVQGVIDRIVDADEITPEQQDYINILGMLIYEYEEKYVSIPDLDGGSPPDVRIRL